MQKNVYYYNLIKRNYQFHNQLICLDMERSVDLIAAMLAVLRYNCAFMLIDQDIPEDRKRDLIKMAAPVGVLSCNKINFMYNSRCQSDENELLGYIVFSSGSTGVPKGVKISAKSLLHAVFTIFQNIDVLKTDRILAASSVSFDMFIVETIISLCNGIKVVLANEKEYKNPRRIIRLIYQQNVTVLQMVPSKMKMLLYSYNNKEWLRGVQVILLGGENPSQKLLQQIQMNTKADIYNLYGLTEDTIWSSIAKISEEGQVHIGKPIRGHTLFLLNDKMHPVQNNEIGELYLSGDGLSIGYINESMFLQPISLNGYSTLAMPTGDQFRFIHGNMVYIGRYDNQIKANGYRISPEEIENVVSEKCLIKLSLVTSFTNESGHTDLCLFFVSDTNLNPSSICNTLVKYLPNYMIPAFFFQINYFPLLPSGKINRKSTFYKELYDKKDRFQNCAI